MSRRPDVQKLSHYDLKNGCAQDLQKYYKLTDRQLEQSIRQHLDGANREERTQFYDQVYDKTRK